jgi:response regulator RpfG family c-di-GMP phosphodiesterase
MNKLKSTWVTLGEPIYRGDRLNARKGLPRDVIRDELVKGRGTQFDPEYVDAFLQLFDEGMLDTL